MDNVQGLQELNQEQNKIEEQISQIDAFEKIVSEERTRQMQPEEHNSKSTFDSNENWNKIKKSLGNIQTAETKLLEKRRFSLALHNQTLEKSDANMKADVTPNIYPENSDNDILRKEIQTLTATIIHGKNWSEKKYNKKKKG